MKIFVGIILALSIDRFNLMLCRKVDKQHYENVYVRRFNEISKKRGSPYPYYDAQIQQHERDMELYNEVAREHQDQRKDYEKMYQENLFEQQESHRQRSESSREASAKPSDNPPKPKNGKKRSGHGTYLIQSFCRSSRPEVFFGKGVLKICCKFTGEHPCRSTISAKLRSNFIEIILRDGYSPVNLLVISRTPFLKNISRRLLFILLSSKIGFLNYSEKLIKDLCKTIWDKVFKNGPSTICGRKPWKNLK